MWLALWLAFLHAHKRPHSQRTHQDAYWAVHVLWAACAPARLRHCSQSSLQQERRHCPVWHPHDRGACRRGYPPYTQTKHAKIQDMHLCGACVCMHYHQYAFVCVADVVLCVCVCVCARTCTTRTFSTHTHKHTHTQTHTHTQSGCSVVARDSGMGCPRCA